MVSEKDKLVTYALLGQMMQDDIKQRQAAFDATQPALNSVESTAAEVIQAAVVRQFNARFEKLKAEGKRFENMDVLELRLWAPDSHCALMQLHQYLMDEYGVFFKLASSSGMMELIPGKLYFIVVVVGKMEL